MVPVCFDLMQRNSSGDAGIRRPHYKRHTRYEGWLEIGAAGNRVQIRNIAKLIQRSTEVRPLERYITEAAPRLQRKQRLPFIVKANDHWNPVIA